MKSVKFRPFWSYDVLKTQEWLNTQSKKGHHFVSFDPIFRTFSFVKGNAANKKYIIIYDKGRNGFPGYVPKTNDYEKIYHTNNYSVLVQIAEEPEYYPSYDQLLSKNQKIKYIAGMILLVQLLLYILPVSMILISALSGNFIIEYEPGGITAPTTTQELFEGILILMFLIGGNFAQIWLLYSYFKLRRTNKKLEKFCGEDIELSFTVPTNTIMSKEDLKKLKREKKLVRKMRPGWFYSPDKYEQWLEEMESKGFNLVKMSKIGNSFYFIKGSPRNMKYHVDYQLKKNPTYFKVNEESGWKLFFTSVSRFFAISVWGQEYTDVEPEYYSDQENKVKHAKRFMLSYIVWLLPMSFMYFIMFGFSIYGYTQLEFFRDNFWLYFTPLIFLLAGIEFLYFSFRLMRYYGRVKSRN
jgi:hypothetical protein